MQRERALTKCYEQNLQMLLAEKMLSQESSFQAIQNAYTEYISSRNSAKDTTAIYYGPSELEFRDFYNYFLSNQKLRFWLPCEQMERLRKTKSLCITQK